MEYENICYQGQLIVPSALTELYLVAEKKKPGPRPIQFTNTTYLSPENPWFATVFPSASTTSLDLKKENALLSKHFYFLSVTSLSLPLSLSILLSLPPCLFIPVSIPPCLPASLPVRLFHSLPFFLNPSSQLPSLPYSFSPSLLSSLPPSLLTSLPLFLPPSLTLIFHPSLAPFLLPYFPSELCD